MNDSGAQTIAGVLAAISAPFFMTLGFIVWDIEWKKARGSAFALNMFKCNLASIAFLVMCSIVGFKNQRNNYIEDGEKNVFSVQNVGFLMLSSCIGIIVGDSAWLEALRLLGATRVLVVDTVKPFVAAGLGRWILGEQVHPIIFPGMALTILGVLLVSLEKERKNGTKTEVPENAKHSDEENSPEETTDLSVENVEQVSHSAEEGVIRVYSFHRLLSPSHDIVRGYIFAVMNVLLDTYGSILTKQFGVGMTTFAINLIRFGFAGIVMISVSFVFFIKSKLLQKAESENSLTNGANFSANPPWYLLPHMSRKGWGKICMGVALVTFICPALSNYALFQIAIALAITLGSLTPLYALILEWILNGNQPTKQGVIGAILAVLGVVILGTFRS